MKQLRKHLTFANVLSCIALFMALGGAAYAAKTAMKVKAKDIANGAVTTPKLHNGAVTTPKLHNRSVISSKIAAGNVGTEALAKGAVRSEQLGGGVVTEGKINPIFCSIIASRCGSPFCARLSSAALAFCRATELGQGALRVLCASAASSRSRCSYLPRSRRKTV